MRLTFFKLPLIVFFLLFSTGSYSVDISKKIERYKAKLAYATQQTNYCKKYTCQHPIDRCGKRYTKWAWNECYEAFTTVSRDQTNKQNACVEKMCGGGRRSCETDCHKSYEKKIEKYKRKIVKWKRKQRRAAPGPSPRPRPRPKPRPRPRPEPDPVVVTEVDEDCVKQCTFKTMLCRKKARRNQSARRECFYMKKRCKNNCGG